MPEQIDFQNRQELVVMPLLDDFSHLSQDELSDKNKGLILKHKLVMREGEHNGVKYSWDELKNAIMSGEDAGIFYDHDDSCSKWLGSAKNITADDKSHEIFADLHIIDSEAAKKLKAGAKWGVSPTIDAEKVIRDGESYALDPKFISYSLVLRPAVRETMLNSEADGTERRLKSMTEKEELAQKEALIQKEELKTVQDDLKKTQVELEKLRESEVLRESNAVLSFEKEIGFTKEAEETERLSELKKMTSGERLSVLGIHKRYAKELGLNDKENLAAEELSAYTAFIKKYMAAHKGATISDAAAAWKKEKKMAKPADEVDEDKKKKYPYPEKKKLDENQASLRAELSEQLDHKNEVNREMLAFMHAQESR